MKVAREMLLKEEKERGPTSLLIPPPFFLLPPSFFMCLGPQTGLLGDDSWTPKTSPRATVKHRRVIEVPA